MKKWKLIFFADLEEYSCRDQCHTSKISGSRLLQIIMNVAVSGCAVSKDSWHADLRLLLKKVSAKTD